MEVILSIKPEFAKKIFEGSKKFEFRRTLFKSQNVEKVIVYASSPISKVIGEFEIENIYFENIDSLWEFTKEFSGISKKYYIDYFEGKTSGYALEVKKPVLYKDFLSIVDVYGIKPPQSFAYYSKER